MARKGRKPKAGNRYQSGKLMPDTTPSVALIRRATERAIKAGKDPWLGTRLGWLVLDKTITPMQAEAGFEFARLFDDYARIAGFPRRTPPASAIDGPAGRSLVEDDQDRIEALATRYWGAREALTTAGALEIVVSVCVDDNAPVALGRATLRKGLDALIALKQMGKMAKSS